jgi:hypothetical protein
VYLLAEHEKTTKTRIQTLEANGSNSKAKALLKAKVAKIATFAQRAGQESWVETVMALDNNFDEGDMFGCVTLESVQVAMEEAGMVYYEVGNECKCAELSPYECCDCSMRHMIQLQRAGGGGGHAAAREQSTAMCGQNVQCSGSHDGTASGRSSE